MTDITDPGTISNGDTPDWDLVQAYFDAIYAVVNSPGQLDNSNIKSAAGIAYSKLNLTGSIATADLAANVVTDAKLATPATGSASNGALVQQAIADTYVTLATLNIATTGFFAFVGECRCSNYGGGTPSGQVQTILSLQKNGTPIGLGHVFKSTETGDFTRTLRVEESFACTAGDAITLKLQSNLAGFVGIQAQAGHGKLSYERRSS